MNQILARLEAQLERNEINKLMDEYGPQYPLMTYLTDITATNEKEDDNGDHNAPGEVHK